MTDITANEIIEARKRRDKLFNENKPQFYIEHVHNKLHPKKGYIGISETDEPTTLEQWCAVARFIAGELEMATQRTGNYKEQIEALVKLCQKHGIPDDVIDKTLEDGDVRL